MLTEKISTILAKMRFHARVFRLGIKREELVLDIGSGESPHYRADVLCDLSMGDDRERTGPINVDRPFVVGDAESLPFRDKAFDFIICSHLLEHVRRPEKCIQELMRVGKRGYIETPSEFAEKLCGWPPHRWFVRNGNGRLIFTEKRHPIYDEVLAANFWKAWSENDSAYHLFFWRNTGLFFTRCFWEDKIDYEIHSAGEVENGLFIDANPGVDESSNGKGLRGLNRFDPGWENIFRHIVLSLLRARNRKSVDIFSLIACPVCRRNLLQQEHRLICQACQKWYSLSTQQVPVLLSSQAKPLEARFG